MRRIQLYGTGAATATSVAQVTIPTKSKIKGIQASVIVDTVTDNTLVRLELSKVPTNQIGVNGAVDPILEIGKDGNFATSGLAVSSLAAFFPTSVDIDGGEIVYLHATVAGTVTYYANFVIHYE